jgi:translation initiation factor 2 alpha subunit (eIF-2alpha)
LALEASLSWNDVFWKQSGIEAVEELLFEFLAKRKTEALVVVLLKSVCAQGYKIRVESFDEEKVRNFFREAPLQSFRTVCRQYKKAFSHPSGGYDGLPCETPDT